MRQKESDSQLERHSEFVSESLCT